MQVTSWFFFLLVAAQLRAQNVTKILFLYSGELGDFGWTYSHNQARNELKYTYRDAIEAEYVSIQENSTMDAVVKASIDEYYGNGFRVFFGCSFGFQFGMFNRSFVYSDAYFISISGYLQSTNMITAFGKIYQSVYLEGLLAGLMTRNNSVCFMGALRLPEVYANVNAFMTGLHTTNPNATLYVAYTQSWYDPALETFTGQFLLDNAKCDYFAQHSDTLNALKVAVTKKAFVNGYNSDSSKILGEVALTSATWNWYPLLDYILQLIWNKQWQANLDIFWGMDKGLVEIARCSFKVPLNTTTYIENWRHFLINNVTGTNVFCGPLFNLTNGTCLNDTEIRSFTGPMSRHLGSPFKLVDLGDVVLPTAVVDQISCSSNCNGHGDCIGNSQTAACICYGGYYGSACQNSIIPPIAGGVVGVIVLIVLVIFRRWIYNLMSGNVNNAKFKEKDGKLKQIRKELLDSAAKKKVRIELATTVIGIVYDLLTVGLEWFGFYSIVIHRNKISHYYIDHPEQLVTDTQDSSILSVLAAGQANVELPGLLIVYCVLLALANLIIFYAIYCQSISFKQAWNQMREGVSNKKILNEMGMGDGSLEDLAEYEDDMQSGIISSPATAHSFGDHGTMTAGSTISNEKTIQAHKLGYLRRQILHRSLQIIILIFHIIPFAILKFFLLFGFLDVVKVPVETWKKIWLIIDICLSLIQIGTLAAVPKSFWSLRVQAKLILFDLTARSIKKKEQRILALAVANSKH